MARSNLPMASYGALLLCAARIASSAALASTALSCPVANGTTVTNSTAGITFTVECGIDRYDNDLGLVYTPTLDSCIAACASNSQCVDVSWIPGNPGPCYMKQGVGSVEYKTEIWGARATKTTRMEELNCPASNGTQYTDPNVAGCVYAIECDTDHFDTDYSTNPVYVAHLEDCIAACDKTTGCQVGVLYGSACYLKHGVNPAIHMPGALGARCVSGCQAVLSSSSSTSAVATSTSTTVPTSSSVHVSTAVTTSTAVPTPSSSAKTSSTASTASTSAKVTTSVTTMTALTTSTTALTPTSTKTSTAITTSAAVTSSSIVKPSKTSKTSKTA